MKLTSVYSWHARVMLALCAASMLTTLPAIAASTTCDPHSYGARGDGKTKDTSAIQHAIDSCSAQAGGTVLLSAGTYLSAPIELKSNVTLHLDKGATLLGSPDHADYPARTEFRAPGQQSLISAHGATHIAITGEGTVDGNGASWWTMARAIKDTGILGSEHTRPRLVVLEHCQHVLLEGVTFQNSPMWQIVPYYSDDVVIRNVRILAPPHAPNTDAIDPFSSTHVLIDHVFADVGDDDIAIKSGMIGSPGPDAPSRYITIRNCTFLHGHGVSVGSELAGGAQDILVEHVRMDGTDNGIRVKANRDRGHDVSNIVFRDMQIDNVKYGLIISEYYPKVFPQAGESAQPIGRLTPHFHDITVENVTIRNAKIAGAIVGLPEVPMPGIVLNHVSISAEKGMVIGYAQVSAKDFHVVAQDGPAITQTTGARLTVH